LKSRSHSTLAGVDGCPGGWIAVIAEGRLKVRGALFRTFGELLEALPSSALVAVDIPIGLSETGPRACDMEARRLLGRPRGSSVFPAPSRAWLNARSYEDACRLRTISEGKKVSRQAFGILRKVREVDELLRASPALRRRVIEVHPELSFSQWKGGPLRHNKKQPLGRIEREKLIDRNWPGARARLWQTLDRSLFARDDLNDAFATLWTAARFRTQGAIALPQDAHQTDRHAIPMRIVA
jgi:predicted RNase H-like nuclease